MCKLHLLAKFLFVLKVCLADQRGNVRLRPIPTDVVLASCIVVAECRVVFSRGVVFGRGRSCFMRRL